MNDGARRPADTYPGPRPAHRSGGAPPTAELGISARIREKFEQDGSFGKLWRIRDRAQGRLARDHPARGVLPGSSNRSGSFFRSDRIPC